MRVCLSAVVIAVALPTVAAAEPVRLEVAGTCPSDAQVQRAFAAEGLAMRADAPWRARIDSTAAAVRLELSREDGVFVATRAIDSGDCAAVAEAIAVIVAATIALPAPPPPAATAEPPPPRTTTPQATTASPSLPPSPSPSPSPPPSLAPPPSPSQSEHPRGWLAASAGVDRATGIGDANFAQFDAGYLVRGPWLVRAAVSTDARDTTPEGMTVHVFQVAARAEAGHQWRANRAWLRASAGVGAVLVDVQVPSLAGSPRVRRLHPMLTGAITGGVVLSDRVSVRAELGAGVRPIVDRYLSGTNDEVARTPRAAASFGVGLQWAAFD